MRLHWSPDSANLIVRLALEELGLPFEAVRLDRSRGDQRAPAYLALNPQGLIPVLEDGDVVLFETGAILWHLVERAGRLGPDAPALAEPRARAAVLKWLFYLSNTPHAELRACFYTHRYVAPADAVGALRRGLAARLRQHLALLDGQLEAGGLAGPELSVADLYLGVLLRWAQLYPTGEPPLEGLRRMAARLRALPAHRGPPGRRPRLRRRGDPARPGDHGAPAAG